MTITNTIIICHDDYEQIKKKFEYLRKKWGLRWGKHYDTKYIKYHEWTGKHDKIEASYIINQQSPSKSDGTPNIEKIWIIYSFNPESDFILDFREILNTISPYYYDHRVEYIPPVPPERIKEIKENLKKDFLDSLDGYRYPFGDKFISHTLELIDNGTITSLYTLRYGDIGGSFYPVLSEEVAAKFLLRHSRDEEEEEDE